MKKFVFLAFCASAIITTANAQFYFNVGMGYAFPQAGQTLDGTSTPYSGTVNNATYTTSYNIKSASFSSGFGGKLGFGYMFSDHVGMQLDAAIGFVNSKYTFTDNNVSYSGYQSNEVSTMQANTPVLFIPSLVLQTGGASSWNIYSRFGIALPINTKITLDQVFYIPSLQETDEYVSQLTSSFSVGFSAAAGVQYKLNDRMCVWGELSMLSMSLFVKEQDLKSASQDGQSVALSAVGGTQTVKYSKNVSVDSNYAQLPTYSQPFSNLGVNVGISFRLSDKRERKHSDLIDDGDRSNFKRRGSR